MNINVSAYVPQILKNIREKTGISQKNLAKYFNIPIRTIQDWEQGKRIPPDYTIAMMLRILDVEGIISLQDSLNPYELQNKIIKSPRHQEALNHALSAIKNSPVSPYITSIYLFGSCSRHSEKYHSDIDILLELHPSIKEKKEYRIPLRLIKSDVATNNVSDPDVDLKIVFGDDWKHSKMLFYENIRKDCILLCL